MELSKEVIGGLQLAGDSTRISEPCFLQLTDCVFLNILKLENQKDLKVLNKTHSTNIDVLNEAYASLFTLTLEAAKHDLDGSALNTILEDKLNSGRCTTFISRFTRYKSRIRVQLNSISNSFPHIVDTDWRLDYCLKSDIAERIDEPVYIINLKTEKSGVEEFNDIVFSCNLEQLQDLISKLKDAVKCMERISQG